ncbi:uncharacterized protein [Heptranchias perlo]|uniref:uncharacterized protein n=1 Tax=Heptranchias perlo TaxID=212740 RepID=UPI003559B4A2
MTMYQVFVRGIEGKTIPVEVANSEYEFNATTALQIKRKLIAKLPANAAREEKMRALFANRQLRDTDKLFDNGITNKSTILIVLQGGSS